MPCSVLYCGCPLYQKEVASGSGFIPEAEAVNGHFFGGILLKWWLGRCVTVLMKKLER